MSWVGVAIISSFYLVIIGVVLLVVNFFLLDKRRGIWLSHYWLNLLAGVIYAGAAFSVFLDRRSWNQFKTELLVLLIVFLLLGAGALVSKKTGRILWYVLSLLILAVAITFFHLKWSGLI